MGAQQGKGGTVELSMAYIGSRGWELSMLGVLGYGE